MKSTRSDRRRYAEDDDEDDADRDVVDVLTRYWEERLKIWRGGNDTDQSHTTDKVSHKENRNRIT